MIQRAHRRPTAHDKRIAVLWARELISGVEAARRLKVTQQNVYGRISRALKAIHYDDEV